MSDVSDHHGARLAVVVVNYNSARLVIEGLPSLVAELRSFNDAIAVIVDNASPDGDGAILEAFLNDFEGRDRIRLIRSSVNGGFAAGNNLAFAMLRDQNAQRDAVMLLNPDAVLRPGALNNLVAVMHAHPRAGLIGAAILHADGSKASAAFNFPSIGMEIARESEVGVVYRLAPIDVTSDADPIRVDWVSGAAFMIRGEVLDRVGGFDEGYFLYFEEVDYARRVTEAGWEVWHAPQAVVAHDPGSSTGIVGGKPKRGRMPRYWFVSWLRYFTKNHGVIYARGTALAKLGAMVFGSMVRLVRRRGPKHAPLFAVDFARACLFAPLNAHKVYEKELRE